MTWTKKILKLLHIAGTGWFVLCVAALLVIVLREAQVRWWVIFSLSGYSAVFCFVLISLYLFAIFRGTVRNAKTDSQHPLTSSISYMLRLQS